MRTWVFGIGALIAATSLSGCSKFRTDLSAQPAVIGTEESALERNLRDGYEGCVDKTCQRMKVGAGQDVVDNFLGAGITLSNYHCEMFFRRTNTSARHRRFLRSANNDFGGAVSTVLGLAKASAGIVGGVAAGFAFADGSIRNYDDSYLVDPDLAKLRRLVHAAQDNMKAELKDEPPTTIFDAESAILRYSGLCSFLGMQELLSDSVTAKTAAIETKTRTLKTGGSPAPAPTPAVSPPPPPN